MPCRSGNLSCAAMDEISGQKIFGPGIGQKHSTTFADVVGNSMQHWNATAQFVSIRASIATSITKRPPKDGSMACWRISKRTNPLYLHDVPVDEEPGQHGIGESLRLKDGNTPHHSGVFRYDSLFL